MPFCALSRSATLQDITPLENVFIQEYMLRAPGDYVKVYIYGLMQCRFPQTADDNSEDFARALGMEENDVFEAYAYWQRRGLIRVTVTPSFSVEYRLVREVITGDIPGERNLYDYAAFNNSVQEIFGQRLFRDFERVYDWFDTYRFSEAVALRLIQYCVAIKGKNVRIAYMDSVAKTWADAKITTVEQADDFITGSRLSASQAKAVLTHIGLKRRPTVDEDALYAKWTKTYGFTQEAILLACKEMTRIQNPNFQYVDKILERYHRLNIISAEQIAAYYSEKGSIKQAVSDIYHTLGIKGTPGEQVLERYGRWLAQWGFSPSAVLEIAKYVSMRPPSTMSALELLLEQFYKLGLISDERISAELKTRSALDGELNLLFARLGLSRAPTAAERTAMHSWREAWAFPLELVLFGAEFAVGADRPFPFLQKVLSNWHNQNIRTVSAAKEASAQKSQKAPATGKTPKSLRYDQRTYTEEELDALIMPIGE